MASPYTAVRSAHHTLVAATVDTVNLTGWWDEVEVLNRTGTAEIYFTVDGSVPTVAGADTFVVAAGVGAAVKVILAVNEQIPVKLISSGAQAYSVTGL